MSILARENDFSVSLTLFKFFSIVYYIEGNKKKKSKKNGSCSDWKTLRTFSAFALKTLLYKSPIFLEALASLSLEAFSKTSSDEKSASSI